MKFKKIVTSIVGTSLMASSLTLPAYAEQSTSGRFQMLNAPENAHYNIYQDTNQNYIYDDEDVLLGTLTCNSSGVGYYNNLAEGHYVAVLQDTYTNIETDNEYAFYSTGEGITSQEAYVSNGISFNRVYSSENDSISFYYDVPLYKQADSRWGSLSVNGSGSTMKSVGCLITSFAMLRSYETGTEILPSQMMKPYSSSTGIGVVFSSGCAMSVPSSSAKYGWNVYGYTSGYGGNGEIATNSKTSQTLLKALYNKVKCGPVIYGGYSTYNGRGSSNHWIVVNGYTGDGVNFSASDFTICDPGATRSTLADYITKYPYWDRIIYNPNSTAQPIVTTTTQPAVTTTKIPNQTTLPNSTTTKTTTTTTQQVVTTTKTSSKYSLSNSTGTTTKATTTTTAPTTTTTKATTTTTAPTTTTTKATTTTTASTTTTNTTTTTTTAPATTTTVTTSMNTVELPKETQSSQVTPENSSLGDVNQDGRVNHLDVLALKRYLLTGNIIGGFSTKNADIDGNSRVTLNDYTALLRMVVK